MKATHKSQKLEKTNVPCLYVSAASGRFYGIFTRNGSQIKRSLKTEDKETARRKLEDLRRRVGRLDATTKAKDITFAEYDKDDVLVGGLAKKWSDTIGGRMKRSSYLRRLQAIRALHPYFSRVSIASISEGTVKAWFAARTAKRAARTCNIERETLIQVLDYAVENGVLLENVAAKLDRKKQGKVHLFIPTKAQFAALVAEMRKITLAAEAADFAEFLAYSGCRKAEAAAVLWQDINFELGVFTVTGGEAGTKNHEPRTVPMFAPLRRLLENMRDRHIRDHGTPPHPHRRCFALDSAKKAIGTACRKAQLPHFGHHALRHFFCSNCIEAAVDFKTIAGWLGHKDGGILVAKTYGHLRDEHSFEMAKRITFDVTAPAAPVANNVIPLQTAINQ
jgi:integrase